VPLYLGGQIPGGQTMTSYPVGSPLRVLPGTGVHAAGIGWHPNTVQAMRAGGCAVVAA